MKEDTNMIQIKKLLEEQESKTLHSALSCVESAIESFSMIEYYTRENYLCILVYKYYRKCFELPQELAAEKLLVELIQFRLTINNHQFSTLKAYLIYTDKITTTDLLQQIEETNNYRVKFLETLRAAIILELSARGEF